jgi:hypothetical protein
MPARVSGNPQQVIAETASQPSGAGSQGAHRWYAVDADAVAGEFGVKLEQGLDADEAASRLKSHGPNRLAAKKKESALQAFLRQYADFMQIILLVAAVVSLVITEDVATSVLLAGLTVLNAVIRRRPGHYDADPRGSPSDFVRAFGGHCRGGNRGGDLGSRGGGVRGSCRRVVLSSPSPWWLSLASLCLASWWG